MVKFKKVNDSLAIDNKDNVWFRTKIRGQSENDGWTRCTKCDSRVQHIWFKWPDKTTKLCDTCIEGNNQ